MCQTHEVGHHYNLNSAGNYHGPLAQSGGSVERLDQPIPPKAISGLQLR